MAIEAPTMVSEKGEATPPEVVMCHRFMIPTSWAEASGVPTRLSPQPPMIMKQQMGFVPCIREKCMMWDARNKVCYDVTSVRTLEKIADGIDSHNAGSE